MLLKIRVEIAVESAAPVSPSMGIRTKFNPIKILKKIRMNRVWILKCLEVNRIVPLIPEDIWITFAIDIKKITHLPSENSIGMI